MFANQTAQFDSNLAREAELIREATSALPYWPNVSVTVKIICILRGEPL